MHPDGRVTKDKAKTKDQATRVTKAKARRGNGRTTGTRQTAGTSKATTGTTRSSRKDTSDQVSKLHHTSIMPHLVCAHYEVKKAVQRVKLVSPATNNSASTIHPGKSINIQYAFIYAHHISGKLQVHRWSAQRQCTRLMKTSSLHVSLPSPRQMSSSAFCAPSQAQWK